MLGIVDRLLPYAAVRWDTPYRIGASLLGLIVFGPLAIDNHVTRPSHELAAAAQWAGIPTTDIGKVSRWIDQPNHAAAISFLSIVFLGFALVAMMQMASRLEQPGRSRAGATALLAGVLTIETTWDHHRYSVFALTMLLAGLLIWSDRRRASNESGTLGWVDTLGKLCIDSLLALGYIVVAPLVWTLGIDKTVRAADEAEVVTARP